MRFEQKKWSVLESSIEKVLLVIIWNEDSYEVLEIFFSLPSTTISYHLKKGDTAFD